MNEQNQFSAKLLQNTKDLVSLYNTNGEFKKLFNKLVTISKVTYRGQLLRTYVHIIAITSPKYYPFEKKVGNSPEKYEELLTSFYKDQRGYSVLLKNLTDIKNGKYSLPLSPQELKLMQELDKMPDDISKLSDGDKKKKEEIIDKIHGHFDQKIAEENKKEETSRLKDINGQPLKIYIPPEITVPTPAPSVPKSSFQIPSFHITSFRIPSFHVSSTTESFLKKGASKAQIATGRFLKVSLPKAISGTGKGILKGLGFGGKTAVGLGAKLGLAATGVGAPVSAVLMAPTVIKVSAKIIKYTAIGIGAILFYFWFNDVNTTGALFPPGTVAESAVLPPGDVTYTSSCPASGTISYPSYSKGGHCSTDYGYDCPCNPIGQGRRANAIDVYTNSQDVMLPKIESLKVSWELIVKNYPVNSSEGGGYGDTFRALVGNNTWFLDLIHLQLTNLETGKTYTSGQPVAKSDGSIVHISIGKNIQDPVIIRPGSNYDCSSNWLPADFMCQ